MKRKILLILLGLILVSQLPFAYRRYRLRRLNQSIQQLATQRTVPVAAGDFIDYQGVIHVHSSLGGHSTGNFAELISAAKANQLDFVVMTEHPQADFDTAAMTLTGKRGGVLFISGNEVGTAYGDRLLLVPGPPDAASLGTQSTEQIVARQKSLGGLAFAAYPSESQGWQQSAIDGVEVYNLFTNAKQINPAVMFFDGLWSYGSYPELLFANFFTRPTDSLQRWDSTLSAGKRKLTAIAGNDAHSNIGLSLNDAAGKEWLGVKLDPYERSFRTVRTHVFIKKGQELTRAGVLAALALGHCYFSFDLFGDPRGFSFTVSGAEGTVMGDEFPLKAGAHFQTTAPLNCRFVLLKDGNVIDQKSGTAADFAISGLGAYRIEAYLDSLPAPVKGQPWIISNPIYVVPPPSTVPANAAKPNK